MANTAIKHTAIDHIKDYPQVALVVDESIYVDDKFMGAASINETIELWSQLQELFDRRGFVLWKWKASDPAILKDIPHELLDQQSQQDITHADALIK